MSAFMSDLSLTGRGALWPVVVRSDELLTRLLHPCLSLNKKGFEWSCDQTGKQSRLFQNRLPIFEEMGFTLSFWVAFFFAHDPKLNCLALTVSTTEGRIKF